MSTESPSATAVRQPADSAPSGSSAGGLDPALRARVLAFIAGTSREEFDALALAVYRYQYRANPAYHRFVSRRGGAAPRNWREIPAVPAAAFKDATLACAPAARVYESSGTTEGPARRAQHHVPDPELYRAAALAGFAAAVLPATARRPILIAAPTRTSHPRSSLGEMVSWIGEVYGTDPPRVFLGADHIDTAGLAAALGSLDPARPVLLVAVTSALLHLADRAAAARTRWPLPTGSVIVDTGGCKGYPHPLSRAAVLARVTRTLGVEPEQIVNEYGMTELCSQYYARRAGPWCAPPWLRTMVCDPASGSELPRGEIGLLRHVDLANLGSVIGIQTEDVGRAVPGGLELLGRATGSEARGCSLLLAPEQG